MRLAKRIIRYLLMIPYGGFLRLKINCRVDPSVYISKQTKFGGYNVIGRLVNLVNSEVGYASYVGSNSVLPNVQIGRYCSIAHNVQVLPYTHPTSMYVSTHPSFFSTLKQAGFTYVDHQKFQEEIYLNNRNDFCLSVGNDVWIGTNVIIMGGVEIGNGAIIAAGSIVTKSVLPFTIVAGVPAKPIRTRFSESEILFLQEIEWWNKSPEWLKSNCDLFTDISAFRKSGRF
jgi:acetyltransferase-like isoleucine patch superfamily enzyme